MADQMVLPSLSWTVRFSDQRGELFGALAKARKGFSKVLKTSSNPFFKSKYADLSVLIDATSNSLSANGLAVLQFPAVNEQGRVVITTVLGHSSGQWAEGSLEMPIQKADAQGVGSATTYGRRYSYGALLNVASEEDDDGNAATGKNGGSFGLASDKVAEQLEWIQNASNPEELKKLFTNAYKEAEKAGDKRAMGQYIAAKDARKAEL